VLNTLANTFDKMRSFIKHNSYRLFKSFKADIFSSEPLNANSSGNVDRFIESSMTMSDSTCLTEPVETDWGGVNPVFITKTQPPVFANYHFNFFKGSPLKLQVYENVLYHPIYHCLYNSDGSRIDTSSYWTRQQQTPERIDVPKMVFKSEEEFIYVGDYTANMHYGHFLIEAIGPLYYLLNDDHTKILCNEVNRPFKSIFVDEFFNLADFKNDFCSFNKLVQVKKAIVPQHTLCFGYEAFSAHRLIPELIAKNVITDPKMTQQPVYFSRTRLNGLRKILNEEKLENTLQEAGVLIVYPETLSLKQQIEIVNKHSVIIACSGSALHTVLFDVLGNKTLIVIEDEDKYDKNFFIVDAIKSINSIYISALRQEIPSELHANRAVNRSLDIDFTIEGLKRIGII
jgi:hypothetical protein